MGPGATYLEMVLAAGEFHLNCKDKQWNIRKARVQKRTCAAAYVILSCICIQVA